MPAHDFDDHHAVKSFGSSVQAVNGFCRDGDRRVEPESVIGSWHVIINRLWDADDRVAVIAPHSHRGRERAVAADDDQAAQPEFAPVVPNLLERFVACERVRARSSQDRPALILNARDRIPCQRLDVSVDQPLPP